MSGYYAVEESLTRFMGANTKLIPIDSVASVSKGAAIHHYNLYYEKLKKIKLKDRMSDDTYIKVGNEFKMFFPRTTEPNTTGTFEYVVPEDGLAEFSVFLYYGINDKPDNLTKLAGKFFPLKQRLKKDQSIHIKWTLDKDKIISIEILELDGKLTIQKDQNYISDEIESNFIQTLEINPV